MIKHNKEIGGMSCRFITAVDRLKADKAVVSHLYDQNNEMIPLCRYGWNRDDGEGYSILRGWKGKKGICKLCMKKYNKILKGKE